MLNMGGTDSWSVEVYFCRQSRKEKFQMTGSNKIDREAGKLEKGIVGMMEAGKCCLLKCDVLWL